MNPLTVTLISILLNLSIVSGGSQVDLRLGDKDFFIGEKFVITLTDVIYWFTGMSIGIIIAITFIIVKEYWAVQARLDTDVVDRNGRLIGSNKYPTQVEERVLKAIYAEPDNYFGQNAREGRLIGSKKYPTHLEDRLLKPVNTTTNNSF